MKIVIEKPLSDCSFTVSRYDRTAVKQSIIEFGNSNLNRAHGTIVTQNGRVTQVYKDYSTLPTYIGWAEFRAAETDSEPLFVVMIYAHNSEPSRSEPIGIDWMNDLTDADYEYQNKVIDDWFEQDKDYVARQNKWLKEKPWTNIKPGMTCDEAVEILNNLGW